MHLEQQPDGSTSTSTSRRQFLMDALTVGSVATSLPLFARADRSDDGDRFTDAFSERVAEMRRKLASDPDRPAYHFVAPAYSIGEGCYYSDGHYHIFYRWSPVETNGQDARWAHAISRDLLGWRDLPFTASALAKVKQADCLRSASSTSVDPGQQRTCLSWLTESLNAKSLKAQGWAGVLGLPTTLSLSGRGRRRIDPAAALACLRRDHQRISSGSFSDEMTVSEIRGNSMEIEVIIAPQNTTTCGVKVLSSPDSEEETVVRYYPEKQELTLDPSRSSINTNAITRNPQTVPLELAAGEPLKLHMFLDRSVIEVFANGVQCLVERVYPSRSDSLDIRLFAGGARARLVSLNAWQIASIG